MSPPDTAAGIPYEGTDCTAEEAVEAVRAVRASAAHLPNGAPNMSMVNFEFRPRPEEQELGFAVDMDETPRQGDYVDVGDHQYQVQRVEWKFDNYEAENDGDLTTTVICDRVH